MILLQFAPYSYPFSTGNFVIIGKSGWSPEERDRQTGEKALERKPLRSKLQKSLHHENVSLQAPWTIAYFL
jgi:hypothetical protein